MTTFIFDVLKDLYNKNKSLSKLVFILPSKRAGLFLKHQISLVTKETIFSPRIISIEEFVEELSLLKSVSNTELIFEFYKSYLHLTKQEETDSFDIFSKWAQVLLQDFNEIDRYLIPQDKIFNYLSAIKDIENQHWTLEENQTELTKNYLKFFNKLNDYYSHFTSSLLSKKIGYQGLIYRQAVNNLKNYIESKPNNEHIFLGFNALNTAEETIINTLLNNKRANIYWDIDNVFVNNLKHDGALFMRRHKSNWLFFKKNPFTWVTNNYSKEKNISVYGIPKNIGQAKYIGALLNTLKKENKSLKNTAVVLGDESLLIPVLNSLPVNIGALNITMGFPLKLTPLASLFESLFKLNKSRGQALYYKDVINLLSHQFIRPLFFVNEVDYASKIIETINENNLVYVKPETLFQMLESSDHIKLIFSDWSKSTDYFLKNCSKLIFILKKNLDEDKAFNLLSLEYLFRFSTLFNELIQLNSKYNYINNILSLHNIYKELLSSETLDFQGEPLQGLQVMGMLESRVLDFETIIISSVNEGILPSGKTNNSFIPFDVKFENKLPTYREKDAVYTYHFYRLLQRAKNVFILYNTEADVLTGGEKSRFITQLELEGIHNIKHQIIAPQVPVIEASLNVINKTPQVISQLKQIATSGFSPSSLTNYIRNPIDFYYQKILKVKDYDDVEETVAANTLGTVVHNTLEDFYKPLEGTYLSIKKLEDLKNNISKTVTKHFSETFKEGDITKGKNLIVFEIAKRYVSNFLNSEIKNLEAGNKIKILEIEVDNSVSINIPELNFPVNIIGKVDRVDEYNGVVRIIDYKTGKVEQRSVEVVNWDDLTTDYTKYSKSFQVLTYVYIMQASSKIQLPVEAGIISFKNLGAGFLKFGKKETSFDRNKNQLITDKILDSFIIQLKKLILEICDIEIPFTEKLL